MPEVRTANSFIENHRWKVAWTTPASGTWIAQGARRFGFVDREGQSDAGGLVLQQHDVTITGGQMPPQESARLKGQQVWVEHPDGSPVDPDEAEAILQNTNLFLEISQTPYDLGPAIAWRALLSGKIEIASMARWAKCRARSRVAATASYLAISRIASARSASPVR